MLNGKRFLVTANLDAALRNFARHRKWQSVPLWIDAIYINQEDISERDQQVRRMKSIYEHAKHVIIWLGDLNDPTDETVRFDPLKWGTDRPERTSEAVSHTALKLAVFLEQEAIAQEDSGVSISLEDFHHSHNLQV
jgi:hypothetical protein